MVQPAHICSLGFLEAKSDTSLFVYRHGSDNFFFLERVGELRIIILRRKGRGFIPPKCYS